MDERFEKEKIRMKFKEQKMLIEKEREKRLEEDFKVIMVGIFSFFPELTNSAINTFTKSDTKEIH